MIRKTAFLLITILFSGCGALPISLPFSPSTVGSNQLLTGTSVSLSKQNYKIVKANAIGKDWGVNLVGIIPVVSPYYSEAITQIYKNVGDMEGRPRALVNIVHQQTSSFYLLFSIPEIIIRADVVEFTQDGEDDGS